MSFGDGSIRISMAPTPASRSCFLNDETEIVPCYHDRIGKIRTRETQRRALEQARIFNEAGKLLGERSAGQGPQPRSGTAAQHDREDWTRQLGVPYVGWLSSTISRMLPARPSIPSLFSARSSTFLRFVFRRTSPRLLARRYLLGFWPDRSRMADALPSFDIFYRMHICL